MLATNANRPIWIDECLQRPICDVPWLGTAIVFSTGDVQFCCFSGHSVGNINEEPFEKVWTGKSMREIRQALIEQRLPPQCQSSSCPIFRGDKLHYIVKRMECSSQSEFGELIKKQLQESRIQIYRGN